MADGFEELFITINTGRKMEIFFSLKLMVSGTRLSSLFYLSVSRETHVLVSFSFSLELLGPLHSLQPTTCFLYFHHSVEYVLFFVFLILTLRHCYLPHHMLIIKIMRSIMKGK